MKKVICFPLLLLMILCFVACGKQVKTEAEVENEILEKYNVLENYPVRNNYHFEVVLRKTDSKKGTDEFQCIISFEDEYKSYKADFNAKYYLYDQGWILDEVEVTDSKSMPLKSTVTLKRAQKDFSRYAPKYSFAFLNDEIDLENSRHTFYFADLHQKNIKYELIYVFKDNSEGGYEWIEEEMNVITN